MSRLATLGIILHQDRVFWEPDRLALSRCTPVEPTADALHASEEQRKEEEALRLRGGGFNDVCPGKLRAARQLVLLPFIRD